MSDRSAPDERAAFITDLVAWLKFEPDQGSLISTSLADFLLARGWKHRPVMSTDVLTIATPQVAQVWPKPPVPPPGSDAKAGPR